MNGCPRSLSAAWRKRWSAWDDDNDDGGNDVARMVLLRDAAVEAHQMRGTKGETIAAWVLEQAAIAEKDVSSNTRARRETRGLLSPRFSATLEPKLRRAGREWERKIAGAAARRGWSGWLARATVAVPKAARFHQELIDSLWPLGVLLFSESGKPAVTADAKWNGRWLFVCQPGFKPKVPSCRWRRFSLQ